MLTLTFSLFPARATDCDRYGAIAVLVDAIYSTMGGEEDATIVAVSVPLQVAGYGAAQ